MRVRIYCRVFPGWKRSVSRLPYVGIVFVLAAACFSGFASLAKQPSVRFQFPENELDLLLDSDSAFRVFHPPEIGGYLAWRLAPVPDRMPYIAPAVLDLDQFKSPQSMMAFCRIQQCASGRLGCSRRAVVEIPGLD